MVTVIRNSQLIKAYWPLTSSMCRLSLTATLSSRRSSSRTKLWFSFCFIVFFKSPMMRFFSVTFFSWCCKYNNKEVSSLCLDTTHSVPVAVQHNYTLVYACIYLSWSSIWSLAYACIYLSWSSICNLVHAYVYLSWSSRCNLVYACIYFS